MRLVIFIVALAACSERKVEIVVPDVGVRIHATTSSPDGVQISVDLQAKPPTPVPLLLVPILVPYERKPVLAEKP